MKRPTGRVPARPHHGAARQIPAEKPLPMDNPAKRFLLLTGEEVDTLQGAIDQIYVAAADMTDLTWSFDYRRVEHQKLTDAAQVVHTGLVYVNAALAAAHREGNYSDTPSPTQVSDEAPPWEPEADTDPDF